MKQNHKNMEPDVLPPREKVNWENALLIFFAVLTGLMLAIALPNLIDTSQFSGIFKVGLLALGASIISYSVNKIAITKGAELFSKGFIIAGVVSIISILAVGIGLFTSTYAGLTLTDTEQLRLQKHGIAYSQYIGVRNSKAAQAARTLPVVRSINRELSDKARCEIRHSCVSGRGNGGRGTISKILEVMAGRANSVSVQLEAGEIARQVSLKSLNKLIAQYQDILANSEINIWKKRAHLQKIDAKINQEISTLDESIPIVFLRSYANELEDGIVISNRPITTKRLNSLLNKNGRSLNAVLDSIEKSDLKRPEFPTRTGVSDTFAYLLFFAPLSALTAVIEIIMPISIWIYTWISLLWEIYRKEQLRQNNVTELRNAATRKTTNTRGGK